MVKNVYKKVGDCMIGDVFDVGDYSCMIKEFFVSRGILTIIFSKCNLDKTFSRDYTRMDYVLKIDEVKAKYVDHIN